MSDLRELYQEVILDHSKRPRNFHGMKEANRSAVGHNPLCGDRVTVFVRVEGDVPHVTVWINDQVVTDTQEKTNRAEAGVVSGPIAIQIHGGNRWVQAGFWRWRNIGIKEF